jgi:serine/threonine protein kinase
MDLIYQVFCREMNDILDNYLWIVMEYCGAGSVSDIMGLCKTVLSEDHISYVLS